MHFRSYALAFAAITCLSLPIVMIAITIHAIQPCQAGGYNADKYLAYCGNGEFGDYEHGALYFGTVPTAISAAQAAQVVFLGDSRVEVAFSNQIVRNFFISQGTRFYNLAFGYIGASETALAILSRWRLHPKVVIINVDPFFSSREEPPLKEIRDHPLRTFVRTVMKAIAERFHAWAYHALSGTPFAPGNIGVLYRSRSDGTWDFSRIFPPNSHRPVDELSQPFQENLQSLINYTKPFRQIFPNRKDCVVFTFIPGDHYSWEGARLLAEATGASYIAPIVPGLTTFDSNHLTSESGKRWSAAFLEGLRPVLNRCLVEP